MPRLGCFLFLSQARATETCLEAVSERVLVLVRYEYVLIGEVVEQYRWIDKAPMRQSFHAQLHPNRRNCGETSPPFISHTSTQWSQSESRLWEEKPING
ncbi:hypothetical protein B0I72DRAFT_140134 [Yarrowia lipolytica]|uniref:Uncharacterized protein n=1 Tax=Yarrowia lipolytica TaxID=4952 RepID=A0A371C6Q2_YARLL|nr:hypothetical protein BKA91DRAFT_131614 [Yarrowia lipolytica]KAE8174315.1 hypothetical protein BKA90DRAFT_134278 [Yarrowia lipolytica]RDW25979.1 hypothetical protein B0I71DRAFT_131600 [Yarrowia lipolytica]RDW31238.1 hypothetical protein B0I72DRAFT_140134 [Yarrowia lipolytica]RDW40201.1 hypothetical protein B0I73DRAFT_130686 [Yarrowia lipolytica]